MIVPTRLPGPGVLLAALRHLLRRVERFGALRADDPQRRWAVRLYTALNAAFSQALEDPHARWDLHRVDDIRRRTSKRRW